MTCIIDLKGEDYSAKIMMNNRPMVGDKYFVDGYVYEVKQILIELPPVKSAVDQYNCRCEVTKG